MSQEGEYEDWVTFTRCCFTALHQGFCFLIKLTILPFQTPKLSAFSVFKRASTSEVRGWRKWHLSSRNVGENTKEWLYVERSCGHDVTQHHTWLIGCRKSPTRALCPAPGPCVGKWCSSTAANNIAQIYTPSTSSSTLVIKKPLHIHLFRNSKPWNLYLLYYLQSYKTEGFTS